MNNVPDIVPKTSYQSTLKKRVSVNSSGLRSPTYCAETTIETNEEGGGGDPILDETPHVVTLETNVYEGKTIAFKIGSM